MRRRVTKFVNTVMASGKKAVAEGIVYGAFDIVAEQAKDDPVKVWERALGNVQPKRRGEVPPRRWLDLPGSRRRPPGPLAGARHALARRVRPRPLRRTTMQEKLASELLDASSNKGNAVKKREDTHKMADANKAFAHYRW